VSAHAPASTAEQAYLGFLDALNNRDLAAAEQFVDVARYREDCVGYTRGWVDWAAAKDSVRAVWKGIPDLHVDLHDVVAQGDVVLVRGTVSGTATGRLFGAPATRRRYDASYFDYVRLDGGRIVERVQQADVLRQMRQLYGKALGSVGATAMIFRLP
jgi:predicted ester cyclase